MDPEIPAVPAEEIPEVPETPETPEVEEELSPEQIVDLKKKAEVSSQNFERAKKAEAELKKLRDKPADAAPSSSTELTFKDALAISKADVHEDDVDEVADYAKLKGISISKALQSDVVKAILADKTEKRNTAAATNVTNTRRGPQKITDEALLESARGGKLPEGDSDIERLVAARHKTRQ